MLGSVLLKGVRKKEFPEFFEKSIDKQKIDAILNSAVRFWSGPDGAVTGAERAGGPLQMRRSRRPSRYKQMRNRRGTYALLGGYVNGVRSY